MTTSLERIALGELQRREKLRTFAEKKAAPPKARLEVGGTGLEVFGGIISGDIVEHNRDWDATNRYDVVDKMRRGDATCAAALLAITLPIVSTDAHIESRKGPKDEKVDPIVEEAAEFAHEALFGDHMRRPWDSILREVMLHLAYGHYPFEQVYEVIERGEYQGAIGWHDFAPRHPRTITEWFFDNNGLVTSVKQEFMDPSSGDRQEVEIPYEKMLVFTNQQEAGNPLGISIYRPAYKHWKYKDGFYAVQAIAIERQGAGTPFAKYPIGTSDDDIDDAEEMLQNIQAHEQSYMTSPEDWEIGFLDMGAGSVLDPQTAIEHHDAMITKSIMAQFLNLPQDGRGSFALSEDQSGFFNFTLQHTASYIASVFNRHAIPRLLDANYPDLPQYPRLRFDRVGPVNFAGLIEGVSNLARDGVLTADIGLENRIRNLLNLPVVDEAEFEEAREVPEAETGEPPGDDFGGDESED